MATFYLVIVPQGVTPTWSRANIGTNSGWTATTIAYHDADTDPGSGATYQFVPDASGLTASTAYDLWAVWDDGATTVGPVQGTGFSTASAGTTYNDTLSESATLADSTAAANLLTALLAETVALADGVTAGATFAQTLIESVTTAESASALMAFSSTISETVSLLDQLNTGNVFNETHAAAVTPADSLASVATFSTALAESTTPADTTTAATAFAVSLAEAVALLDTSSNGSLYNEVLTASAALSDALTSTATLSGAVVESAALSDALDAIATFQAALTETVTAGDFVATQADQATLPRKVLTARITALSFAARVEATALSGRLQ